MSLSTFIVLSAFAITFYEKKKNKNLGTFSPSTLFPSALPPTEATTPSTTTWLACVVLLCGALVILQTPSNTRMSDSAGAAESTVRAGSLPGSASSASRLRVPLSSYCYRQTFPLGFKLLAAHGDY